MEIFKKGLFPKADAMVNRLLLSDLKQEPDESAEKLSFRVEDAVNKIGAADTDREFALVSTFVADTNLTMTPEFHLVVIAKDEEVATA